MESQRLPITRVQALLGVLVALLLGVQWLGGSGPAQPNGPLPDHLFGIALLWAVVLTVAGVWRVFWSLFRAADRTDREYAGGGPS